MKEYIKIAIAISLFFVYITAYAQNLVPNGSFEIYSQCPINIDKIYYCTGWFQPHKYPGGFSVNQSSSSDYYSACSDSITDVPNNFAGYQIANSGNSYIGIGLYSTPWGGNGYREYAEVKLNQELIANKKYNLQYFVSMANTSQFSITKFDAYLSNDSLLFTTLDFMNIPVVPQLQYNGRIDDTLNWFAVNASFIAQGGERFLTLGNFHDGLVCDTLRTLITSTSFCCSAYYFIDDVSLVEDTTLSIKEVADVDFAVYPNPSNGNFKVISQQKISEINIMDIGNKIALRFIPSKETVTIDVGQLEVGIYIMQCKFNNGDVRYKKIVIQR